MNICVVQLINVQLIFQLNAPSKVKVNGVSFRWTGVHLLDSLCQFLGDEASLQAEGYYLTRPDNKMTVWRTGRESVMALTENRR